MLLRVAVADQRSYTSDVNVASGDGAVVADPTVALAVRGLRLDAVANLGGDRRSAFLIVRNQWHDAAVAPGGGAATAAATTPTTRPTTGPAPSALVANADRYADRSLELSTSTRVPVGKMVLIGGMTLEPASPVTRPAAAAPAFESKPQLYLFIEVTAG